MIAIQERRKAVDIGDMGISTYCTEVHTPEGSTRDVYTTARTQSDARYFADTQMLPGETLGETMLLKRIERRSK